jgi:hypothetical protein
MRGMSSTGQTPSARAIDDYSFALGLITAFVEVVAGDIKQLALSEPATPAMMDALLPEARRIAAKHQVLIHREPDLIVTDLFPADAAAGQDVLLIYRGDVLQRYQALKAERTRLTQGRAYAGAARRDIARRFGKLLSYSDARIDALLAGK